MTAIDALIALPEIILAVGVLFLILFGALRNESGAETISLLALVVLAGGFLAVFALPSEHTIGFGGLIVMDAFAKIMKALTIIAAAAAISMSVDFMRHEKVDHFEFPILILLATIGMMMMISANNLLGLYLGMELLSLPSYVIASLHRENLRSTEAGVKYFILGALSSGMLLYGASLIYGFTGSLQFDQIAQAVKITGSQPSIGLIFGLCFMAAGAAFKISAVPFHMWTPDVYEGAPTPVTAFFAGAPKVAGLAMIVRLFVGALIGLLAQWQQIIYFIAAASMIIGAFGALGQHNFKRLMAYSSIGNVGYALIGLAAGSPEGISGLVLYLVMYVAMTVGTFACIIAMRKGDKTYENIYDLAGLGKTHPVWAFGLLVMMFSLAAIPPMAGFFGKLLVFMAAIKAGLLGLVIIGVLTSVVSAYYYLRIVKIMYFDEPKETFENMPLNLQVILGISSAVILFGFIFAGFVVSAADYAAGSLW